jgi:hypothetical protein
VRAEDTVFSVIEREGKCSMRDDDDVLNYEWDDALKACICP